MAGAQPGSGPLVWWGGGGDDDPALAFDDVTQLNGRFNAALQDCDFGSAKYIIAALFSLDREDLDDARSLEVQRADLGRAAGRAAACRLLAPRAARAHAGCAG